MTDKVAVREPSQAVEGYTRAQIDLIKSTICKGASDDELRLFLYQAKRLGLDPLANQVYAVRRYSKEENRMVMAIQTGIDGYRVRAERTGKYAGQQGPWWCGKDGAWKEVWLEDDHPFAARVCVLRTDFKDPISAVARYSSYVQFNRQGQAVSQWATMPDVMLAKCAEALAIRKAFPQETAELSSPDEAALMEEPDKAKELPAVVSSPAPPPRSQVVVESKSRPGLTHLVDVGAGTCSCEAFAFRGSCSHLAEASRPNLTPESKAPDPSESKTVDLWAKVDELCAEKGKDKTWLAKYLLEKHQTVQRHKLKHDQVFALVQYLGTL